MVRKYNIVFCLYLNKYSEIEILEFSTGISYLRPNILT